MNDSSIVEAERVVSRSANQVTHLSRPSFGYIGAALNSTSPHISILQQSDMREIMR